MESTANNKQLFEDTPVWSAIRIMAIPTIISQLIVLIYNMADTFYLGRTNNPYMVAGVSLILPIFNISLSLAGLAGVGGGTLISRLMGQARYDEASKVSMFSIYLSIAVAALFAVGTGLFLEPILKLLGAGEQTFTFAWQYTVCVIVAGGVPTVLSNVLANLLRSVGYSKKAGFGITMGSVLNMVLDPLFMFVLLPKGFEVLGVGLATCLSNCVACLYFLFQVFKTRKSGIITCNPKVGLPEAASIRSIFGVGIPSSVSTLLFDLDYVVLDKLMVSYGDIALAAVGIVLKIERLPLNVGVGICQGMVPLVAYNYSARNYKRMHSITRCSRGLGLTIAAISICLYELSAIYLLRFFITDAATVALGVDFLRVRVLATPLMFLSFFTVYLFNAFGAGSYALFLGTVRWLGFNIPMLFLLNAVFGMYGLVWAQVSADIITVSLSFYMLHRYLKQFGLKV
ncbi:MAG: MATE family efflux transporter [Pygmaiobacter massiliensis]|nr:MATE family efflux transporter [Pygmaiobacter massiliensis]